MCMCACFQEAGGGLRKRHWHEGRHALRLNGFAHSHMHLRVVTPTKAAAEKPPAITSGLSVLRTLALHANHATSAKYQSSWVLC